MGKKVTKNINGLDYEVDQKVIDGLNKQGIDVWEELSKILIDEKNDNRRDNA